MNTNTNKLEINREKAVHVQNGWVLLPLNIILCLGSMGLFIYSIAGGVHELGHPFWGLFVGAILLEITSIISFIGFFTLQPNEARVLVLFGAYRGTVRDSGFHWGNPFYSNEGNRASHTQEAQGATPGSKASTAGPGKARWTRFKVSLRARNFNSDKLKVNDKRGNPVEIAAVVIWRVQDTAQASFDVDDFENYVRVQSESPSGTWPARMRTITVKKTRSPCAAASTRSPGAQARTPGQAGQSRCRSGRTRLTHLAYAPEIAQAMLRRQQAEAVIAARQKIVHGAVSMVDMALRELAEKQVVELDTNAGRRWSAI